MLKLKFSPRLVVPLVTIFSLLPAALASAQIVPDTTLPNNSVVTPGCTVCTIDGGTVRGVNLYHSFQQFSVPTGGEAYFNNAVQIQNILTRVTGANISNVDGLIRANGPANLFLMNPNGVVFGPNARLDIGGTFVATTASAILFKDGTVFSATNPSAPPLLTIQVPLGLQFNGTQKNIMANNSSLNAKSGQTIALVGGQILLDGANINAPGGLVTLGGLAASGTVGLNIDPATSKLLSLEFPQNSALTDVAITNNTQISATASVGGGITVNAHNLTVTDSALSTGIAANQGSPGNQAGDIQLSATEDIILQNSSVFDQVQQNAVGNAGNISIATNSLALSGGAEITASTFGQGNAGTISIAATNQITFDGVDSLGNPSGVFSDVEFGAVGNAGNISIATGSLDLSRGAEITDSTFGQGNAGNISIAATNQITFDGVGSNGLSSGVFSLVNSSTVGNAGNISIATGSLSLSNGADISASTFGQGNAGTISIAATNQIILDGVGSNDLSSGIASGVNSSAVGNAGNISISANSLSLSHGAVVGASTGGQGNAGTISIAATNQITFDGVGSNGSSSGVFSSVNSSAVGNAGTISLSTGFLSLSKGAEILARTLGHGNAGTISIAATDQITLDGVGSNGRVSGIASGVNSSAVGNGGNISLSTGSLLLSNGAEISNSTFGQGNAGTISIAATDQITLDGVGSNGFSSGIVSNVSSGTIGNGGNISIATGSLILSNGAEISDSTLGHGNAGTISITATDQITLDGVGSTTNPTGIASDVALGAVGNGGNISIITNSLALANGADLTVSTFGHGNGGNISITATDQITLDGAAANGNPTGVDSSVAPGAVGNAGTISITTNSLALSGGAEITDSTSGHGNAGNISIAATDKITLDGVDASGDRSGVVSVVNSSAVGNGGNITISANSLSLSHGAVVGASTGGQGNAGSIIVEVANDLILTGTGTGIFASTTLGTTGQSGSIFIDPQRVFVVDGAKISVNSRGNAAGGDLTIQANSLTLNHGSLLAATDSTDGGNINLTIRDLLLMRYNSLISATAGTSDAGGNGGNVVINTNNGFVLAVLPEDSDIRAEAFTGRGGNIQISAQGIYGFNFPLADTLYSDIDASSKFGVNGTVIINVLGIDPTQGLTTLPGNLADPSKQIAQGCSTGSNPSRKEGRFVVIGRGGVPASPEDLLSSNGIHVDLGGIVESRSVPGTSGSINSSPSRNAVLPGTISSPDEIIEMQGWVVRSNGDVFLVAQPPSSASPMAGMPMANCNSLP